MLECNNYQVLIKLKVKYEKKHITNPGNIA